MKNFTNYIIHNTMTNKENKPILKCWVARNLNGTLGLSTEKPLRLINLGVWGVKFDLEAEGSNDEGWHIEITNYQEGEE